ncbi:MAG: putative quinol monooxygenase [Alphaproteobacteria bacterium]
MTSLIVTVRAKPGKAAEYEKISGAFGRHVEANRPGCILFRTFRTDDPLEFITIEHFEDQESLDAHQAHQHTLETLEKLKQVLDGGLDARIFKDEHAV